MAILLDENSQVVIQGITGKYAANQTKSMLTYGTKIVGGVSPGKSGTEVHGIHVFDTLAEIASSRKVDASIIYTSAPNVLQAVTEAIESGVKLIVIPTEFIPVHDTMIIRKMAKEQGVWIVGPNCLGMISPGKSLLGTLSPEYTIPGNVGVISRSGTLSLEVVRTITEAGLGQSTCISIGGDMVLGNNPIDYLKAFEKDPETDIIVMLGEIGGMKEYEAAEYIKTMKKPVVSFIVGKSAKPGRRMGHIGAIVSGGADTAENKINCLQNAGVQIADTPWDIPRLIKERLQKQS
ncbi:succinate--CoA ligase subunit alpha [Bacillaceae bacterium S4-13-56]